MPDPTRKPKYVGKVRLIRRIGHGSMGVVYRGFHEELDREVAIKILSHRDDDTQRRILRRFQREGKAAATVDHPNVVRVFESAEYHGRPYIVMELVDGASLGDVLDEKGRVPLIQAAPIAIAIASGLAAIHAAGIIHRDIKPDNILLGHGGVVKITDLGLARYLDNPDLARLTATGVVVGTPLYVSPESISDTLTAGPEADIYSLGATIYHMISGRPPFDGATPYELMKYHLQYEPVPISELVPDLPAYFSQAVMDCLEKSPAQRPTAPALVAMLQGQKYRSVHDTRKLVLIAVIATCIAAAILWFALAPGTKPTATASITITGLPTQDVWRYDGGVWMQVDDDPVHLEAGDHHLEFRHLEPNGQLRVHQQRVRLEPDSAAILAPAGDLRPIPVSLRLVGVPGTGVVYRLGRAWVGDPDLPFAQAGTYWVSRWNGRSSLSAKIEVREDEVLPGPWRAGTAPDPRAYFLRPEPDSSLPPYHIVCQQELRYLAAAATAGPPPTLDETSLEAATGVTEATVRDWERWRLEGGARLPTANEARALSDLLQVPIWSRNGPELTVMGDNLKTAPHLFCIPVEPLP